MRARNSKIKLAQKTTVGGCEEGSKEMKRSKNGCILVLYVQLLFQHFFRKCIIRKLLSKNQTLHATLASHQGGGDKICMIFKEVRDY